MKNFYLAPIKAYQYISKMLPASCRYYPTCPEYASSQFEFNAPHKAFLSSGARILRCNQFFKGGIDYPLVELDASTLCNSLKPNRIYSKIHIKYWLVPQSARPDNKYFYIVKDFDAIKRSS
jgi:putative membrane protein insertion efficiency factor